MSLSTTDRITVITFSTHNAPRRWSSDGQAAESRCLPLELQIFESRLLKNKTVKRLAHRKRTLPCALGELEWYWKSGRPRRSLSNIKSGQVSMHGDGRYLLNLLCHDPIGVSRPSARIQATSGRGLPVHGQRNRKFFPSWMTTVRVALPWAEFSCSWMRLSCGQMPRGGMSASRRDGYHDVHAEDARRHEYDASRVRRVDDPRVHARDARDARHARPARLAARARQSCATTVWLITSTCHADQNFKLPCGPIGPGSPDGPTSPGVPSVPL